MSDLDPLVSISASEFISQRLTERERENFLSDGYLLVKNALPGELFESLRGALYDLQAQKRSEGLNPDETTRQAMFSGANSLQENPAIHRLITNPRVLAKVVDILGCNIYVYHAHANVTPPALPGTQVPASFDDVPSFGFHQDSARVNVEMGHDENAGGTTGNPRPRLSVKCAYYLTDMTQAGRGNTWVIRGSHLRDDGVRPPQLGQPEGAIPVLAEENSCLIFDRRCWHAASNNFSPENERLAAFVGYGFRWIRPRDGMYVEPALKQLTCPIARQLLGATTSNQGLYSGNRSDLPLRAWLHDHGIDDGLGYTLPQGPSPAGLSVAPSGSLEGDVGHATFPRNPEQVHMPRGDLDGWRFEGRFPGNKLSRVQSTEDARKDLYSELQLGKVEIDASQFLAHRLTDVERDHFERDGYLIVDDALPLDHLEALKQLLLDMQQTNIANGVCKPSEVAKQAGFSQANNMQESAALVSLLRNPKTFAKVVDILGWNIYTCVLRLCVADLNLPRPARRVWISVRIHCQAS